MKKIPYFDGHCDTIYRCLESGKSLRNNDFHVDLARMAPFSRYAQVFALFSTLEDAPPEKLFDRLQRLHDTFLQQVQLLPHQMAHCRTAADISAAVNQGQCAALLSIEGGELLECDPDKIAVAAQWGVKWINPTWNHANALSGTHCEEPERGLSDVGRAFVRQAQRSGILMDVSHLSPKGFWDLMEITEQPVVASHSNSQRVCGHSRNLTDDQFRAITETGGVVGMNFYGAFIARQNAVMEDLIAHIEHFLALNGEKTVALGGDLDGCDVTFPGMEGIQGIPNLWNALEERGYPQSLLEDLFFNNWLRLM